MTDVELEYLRPRLGVVDLTAWREEVRQKRAPSARFHNLLKAAYTANGYPSAVGDSGEEVLSRWWLVTSDSRDLADQTVLWITLDRERRGVAHPEFDAYSARQHEVFVGEVACILTSATLRCTGWKGMVAITGQLSSVNSFRQTVPFVLQLSDVNDVAVLGNKRVRISSADAGWRLDVKEAKETDSDWKQHAFRRNQRDNFAAAVRAAAAAAPKERRTAEEDSTVASLRPQESDDDAAPERPSVSTGRLDTPVESGPHRVCIRLGCDRRHMPVLDERCRGCGFVTQPRAGSATANP